MSADNRGAADDETMQHRIDMCALLVTEMLTFVCEQMKKKQLESPLPT